MNTSTPSSSAGPTASSSIRKERGAIAAQACENCRQRKQRCSEERPKCANCVRMKLECKYREPLPTKKDKTLVEILDRLKSLEGKVDELNIRGTAPASMYGTGVPTAPPLPHTSSTNSIEPSRSSSWPPPSTGRTFQPGTQSTPQKSQYEYVSGAYKMLTWPFVQNFLQGAASESSQIDFASIQKGGPGIILGMRPESATLPADTLASEDHLSVLDPSIAGTDKMHFGTTHLTWETVRQQSKAYFDNFNMLYPIVDRQLFQTQILPLVATCGFDGSINSTLALLVLSLGEVAISSTKNESLAGHTGRPRGLKGGSPGRPPGLLLFNEARKRMGFNLTDCSVQNVQIFALASLYYGTCCLHTDFWRMASSASLACQALLTSKPDALKTKEGDLIRRLFWHCLMIETCLTLEFDIPSTGLHDLEGMVGLPDFSTDEFSQEDYISNQASHFQEHFASQIVLRRLSVEFNTILLHANEAAYGISDHTGTSQAESLRPSPVTTMKQLAAQLDQWRGLLPAYLSWADTPFDSLFSTSHNTYGQSVQSQPTPAGHSQVSFSIDFDSPEINYLYAEDIQTAMLRTRYFYVKYLIHRPFMYKALHHPEQLTQEDAEGVAICLQSSLLWPVAMSPIRGKKRLVPCIVFWSQNLFGILLLLHLSQHVPILERIRSDLLGDQFTVDAKETVHLYIDWIRDLKDVDATASWCWSIIETLFPLESA